LHFAQSFPHDCRPTKHPNLNPLGGFPEKGLARGARQSAAASSVFGSSNQPVLTNDSKPYFFELLSEKRCSRASQLQPHPAVISYSRAAMTTLKTTWQSDRSPARWCCRTAHYPYRPHSSADYKDHHFR